MSQITDFNRSPRRLKDALIADEDPAVIWLLGSFLRTLGWRVQGAPDHETALELFSSSRQDLLICDVHLKGWHGIETANACTAMRPSLKVVMISSFSGQLDCAKNAGFRHCFRKPFNLTALKAAIDDPGQQDNTNAQFVFKPRPVPAPRPLISLQPVYQTI